MLFKGFERHLDHFVDKCKASKSRGFLIKMQNESICIIAPCNAFVLVLRKQVRNYRVSHLRLEKNNANARKKFQS